MQYDVILQNYCMGYFSVRYGIRYPKGRFKLTLLFTKPNSQVQQNPNAFCRRVQYQCAFVDDEIDEPKPQNPDLRDALVRQIPECHNVGQPWKQRNNVLG